MLKVIFKKLKKFSLIFISMVLVSGFLSTYSFTRFYESYLHLPQGCDEFGYLNLAEAIRTGRTFDDHVDRPFFKPLINDLQKSGIEFGSYAWMLAPHAHHIDAHLKNKIINQYPPGTSLLGSILPKKDRPAELAFLSVFFSVFMALFAVLISFFHKFQKLFIGIYLIILFFYESFIRDPFESQYFSINSLIPTYGLLIGSGILLYRSPLISIIFMGLAANFRVANIILLAPLCFYYVFRLEKIEKNQWRVYSKRMFFAFVASVFATSPYFLYTYFQIGNPFFSTYSSGDKQFANLKLILENFNAYISLNEFWFRAHLFPMTLLIVLTIFRKIPWKFALFIMTLIIYNYSFFVIHHVQMSYYPYATALLCFGILIYFLNRFEFKIHKQSSIMVVAVLMCTFSGLIFLKVQKKRPFSHRELFETQSAVLLQCFNDADMVWAEGGSSTVEYAIEKPGLRYNWGSEETRAYIMHWLLTHNYKQVIWQSDIEKSQDELEIFLKKYNLQYEIAHCNLGTYYTVSNKI